MRITHFIAAAGILAAGLGLAVPAAAQDRDTQTQAVITRDLDPGTAQDRVELHHRLVAAVRQVCGTADTADMQQVVDMRSCRVHAYADAARQAQRVVSAHQAATFALASQAPY